MSWLARSLANSLRLDDGDGDGDDDDEHERYGDNHHSPSSKPQTSSPSKHHEDQNDEFQQHENPSRGVKEDLSELKQTLTRQLWGVASFLAPPSSSSTPSTPSHSRTAGRSASDWNRWEQSSDQSVSGYVSSEEEREETADSVGDLGIHSDIADFRNKAVSEISQIALNFLPFGSDVGKQYSEEYGIANAVGVTEEVMAFARNISMHPETWLDFPQDEEEDIDDFDMSDAQREHTLAVERLAPRLAALRIELCPSHMSKGYFWKVYFVLLHSRLNKHDAELLSTPQVMAARALWMQELQKQTKEKQDWPGRSTSYSNEDTNLQEDDFVPTSFYNAHSEKMPLRTYNFEPATSFVKTDFETEKHPVVSSDMKIIDKSVTEEKLMINTEDKVITAGPSSKVLVQNYEDDDDDDWPVEENSELGGFSGATILVGNEEDVSFSDLEDDDDIPIKSKYLKGH